MPHYSDGTLAQVGDVVKGKGYNIKDENGELKEIAGVLIFINPSTSSCNVQVLVPYSGEKAEAFKDKALLTINSVYYHTVPGIVEYGQADHFTKV